MEDTSAVHFGELTRTHDEIRRRAESLATAYAGRGLGYGDRVAIVMRNDIAFIEATLAAGPLGAIPVPVNWHWRGEELAHLIRDSKSKIVVAHTDFVDEIEKVLPAGVEIIEAAVPDEIVRAYALEPLAPTGRHPLMDRLIEENPPTAATYGGSPMGVVYTSGTTGLPKGVLRQPIPPEHAQLLATAVMEMYAADRSMSTLVCAPMYHSAPNLHALFAVGLDMDLTILARFDAEELLETVQSRRIEHLQLVPTMFVRMLNLDRATRESYDVSSLRSIVHAAAPCPVAVKQAILDWFGPIVSEYYGGSETGAAVLCNSEEWQANPGTVGRPYLDADVKIFSPGGEELSAGETGDVYLKPFTGWPDFSYIGNDAKRRDMERDGYLTVGDVGHVNERGFLFLSDRRNDMIISGGVNIYPAEIEGVLTEMPGVADSAVFGIPNREFGESVAAHVQLHPGARVTGNEIADYLGRRLARYKVPRLIVLDEDLPRDESGKLFKRKLKAKYWKETAIV